MTERDDVRRARTALRDRAANSGEPQRRPIVSDQALTQTAHEVGAMVRPADLTRSVQAATLPPVAPGQSRPSAAPAARPQSGPTDRTRPDRNGPTR
ncbi:hypothetical protein [Kribbella sp. NPDC048915]|uniref:hypothetical protein n=1 Tax=Kribbella sp. NPDC048915 TaxID=3155148 RepID=UPI0033E8D589